MPWKVGGNFESVWITCESNWKECAIAIAHYLWNEIVSDVVDYLKEGMIWVLAIVVTSTILFRIKYRKTMHTNNIIISKDILSKIVYKIRDLELKVNVLTYKIQYGSWPLPHQIYSLNPKKLRKIKMTLSNPGDRKNWIKHVLLSPVESDTHSNIFNSNMEKLNNFLDIKQKPTSNHVQCDKLPTDWSSVEASKSTSDQTVNVCSGRSDIYMQNTDTKENDLSRSKNFTLQRQNIQLLPLSSDKTNRQASKPSLIENNKSVISLANIRYNSCQEFTDTIYQCKSFLKELECNSTHLHSLNYLSESSEASLKKACTTKRATSFTVEEKKTPYDIRELPENKKITTAEHMKATKDIKPIESTDEIYRQSNVDISANEGSTKSNNDALQKQLVPIIPSQTIYNVQTSRETLYEVRKRLQSLHNVLRTYEIEESINQMGETAETFVSSKAKKTGENKADTNCDSDSGKNLREICSLMDNCQYSELNHSGESSSSLADYSSNISNKTYQCSSDIASRNIDCKDICQHNNNVQRPIRTKDSPILATESNDYRQYLPFYSAISHVSKCHENQGGRNAYRTCNSSGRSQGNVSKLNSKINKNAVETSASFDMRKEASDTISEEICCISPEMFEDEDIQIQDGITSTSKIVTEKFNDIFNGEQYEKNMIIISQNNSRNKMLKNIDKKDKSTALLLQEALHFKNALLTRIESEDKHLVRGVKKNNNVSDESSSKYGMQIESKTNFPSMVFDVQIKEPITNNSHEKMSQHYIYLEMKKRRDLCPSSLQNASIFKHSEADTVVEKKEIIPEASSEYFSISDLAIHDNDKVENNVLFSLKPPVYEKVISITIPVDIESQDVINTNDKSLQTESAHTRIHADFDTSLCQNVNENVNNDDVDNNESNKLNLPMLKLEDLILERVKNIRDYMDSFLQSQNSAISEARRALQCRDESTLRCSNEASHVILHNRLTVSSRCESNDPVSNSSKNPQRSGLLIDTWSNYKNEILIKDNILNCCPDLHLKRNPGMFKLLAPIKNIFSSENDAPCLELERRETDLSLPIALKNPCKNISKTMCKIINLDTPNCKEDFMSDIKNNTINDQIIGNTNTDFQKKETQIKNMESKFPAISYFSLDIPHEDADIAEVTRNEHAAEYHCDSISHSSYFTDEAVKVAKIDNVFSKSKSNAHTRIEPDEPKEKKQDDIERQILTNEYSDVSIITPNKLLSNITLTNTNFISDKSGHDYSTNTKITLKGSNADNSNSSLLPFPLDSKKTSDISSNNIKQNKYDKISVHVPHLSPQIEHSAKRLHQKHPQIKAKSDIYLITNTTKHSNNNLCPKRSHSFLIRDNTFERNRKIFQQFSVKPHNNLNKCTGNKNESRSAIQSKFITSPQGGSAKSYIPILRSRLETARRIKQQQTKSPTRSPLTMLWREKKNYAMDEQIMNKLNFAESDIEKNILAKLEETNTTKDASEILSDNQDTEILSDNQNTEFLVTDKEEHSDKKFIDDGRTDTRTMEHVENTEPKALIISITTNDNLQQNYTTNSLILRTENICPVTNLLRHKELWATNIEKMEKGVIAKPSITHICTSMSDLHQTDT